MPDISGNDLIYKINIKDVEKQKSNMVLSFFFNKTSSTLSAFLYISGDESCNSSSVISSSLIVSG